MRYVINWLDNMNLALDYIESNLTKEIDFDWDDVGQEIHKLNKRFYGEWLPTAGYEQASDIALELYGGKPESGQAYIEMWYTVKRKINKYNMCN